ncbi:MAG TPA: DUF1918 domain-containing protein [Propionibacteriaceae bacterium]
MEAAVSDRIVVAAAMLDGPVGDGEIIEVGTQGGPPTSYAGPTTGERRFSPGPDAHISHHGSLQPEPAAAQTTPAGAVTAATPHPHVKNWREAAESHEVHLRP